MSPLNAPAPRRGLPRLLAVVAVLFAVLAMHSMGDHDLNAASAPTVAAVASHAMHPGEAAAAPEPGARSDGHGSHHGVDGCLALLAAAAGLPSLAGACVGRAPALPSAPDTARRRWISARGGGTSPPQRELSLLGICRT